MSKKAHQIYWTSQVETKSIDSFEEFIGLGFCRFKKHPKFVNKIWLALLKVGFFHKTCQIA